MINSSANENYSTRESLVRECDNISKIRCSNCGFTGKWIILRIELKSERPIKKQFIIGIDRVNDNVTYTIQGGIEQFDSYELSLIFKSAINKLEKTRSEEGFISSRPKGKPRAIVTVDLFEEDLPAEATIVSNNGILHENMLDLFYYLNEQFVDDEDNENVFLLSISEIAGKVSASIEGGHSRYSEDELKMIFDAIIKKMGLLIMENLHDYVADNSTDDSSAVIEVEFLEDDPFVEVSRVDVSNMSYNTITHLIIHLERQLTS